MPTLTRPLSAEEAASAAHASQLITEYLQRFAEGVDRYILRPDDGGSEVTIGMPRAVLEVLRDILDQMGRGNAVRVMPMHVELTTQEAADLLNVSRPHVVKLIEGGKLPARKVGTHRRVRVEDVLNYQRKDDERRQQLLDELAREAEELGLGYE